MKNSSPVSEGIDVCVVGGGVIGKAAALALAQAGQRVCLLIGASPVAKAAAAAAGQGWDARVYAVNQVAHDLLDGLKVWDALDAARVTAVDGMVVTGDAKHRPGVLEFDAYSARVGALAWIVEDRNLNQALDAALKFAPNLRIVNAAAKALQSDMDAATLQLDNGEAVAAKLVVGADGGQSWVRSQCDIGLDYRSYEQRAIVSNFACTQAHHGVAYQWFTEAQGIVALLPLPDRQVSLVWSAPETLAQTLLRETPAQLAQRLSLLAGAQLGELTPLQPEIVRDFPLALIKPHAMIAPRVALIGDAAHVIHPLAGHGMNLGFADVAVLVKTINGREPQRDCGDPRVLARYARMRKEDVLLMQIATDSLARLFAVDAEPLRMVRNAGLHLVNRLPALKRRLMTHALGQIK
ncbi:FAD-dependent oxidoreductase [Oxalobacteraceae bacterium CAVE-383]|nr:FAD-dependent oxidoreductase [Oxalobacteraceae bacterium CAVE-383]